MKRFAALALLSLISTTALSGLLVACGTQNSNSIVLVAVATNFEPAMAALEPVFEAQSGIDLQISYGSTGKLYAQIRSGAPYDVFLSADEVRAEALADRAVSPPFPYAVGGLALYSRDPFAHADAVSELRNRRIKTLAIANPELAPYGRAATQVLDTLSKDRRAEFQTVLGENVGQAFTLVATGNAELGLVSAAQALRVTSGYTRLVPRALHSPIRQNAVHLSDTTHATAFITFLTSDTAQEIIQATGYSVP